jgi:hypothetical protein
MTIDNFKAMCVSFRAKEACSQAGNSYIFIQDILETFDHVLASSTLDIANLVFNEATYWYFNLETQPTVWRWVVKIARQLEPERRYDLAISFFDPILDGVPSDEDLRRIWSLFLDRRTRWVIPRVYKYRVNCLWDDLDRIDRLSDAGMPLYEPE